ncbi:hypothetical protein K7G19_19695 [Cupriavidus sp. DB3]|nr:hypothetical protein [Cupriavidus sp. DB3]MCA7085816.1 hypothetical protein [Cupriavidus sp. DB3]
MIVFDIVAVSAACTLVGLGLGFDSMKVFLLSLCASWMYLRCVKEK